MLDYSEYTIENGTHYLLQSSPMVASQDASVGDTRTGDRAYYYWLYPNFMINLYEGVMDTNLVLPLGQDKCLVVFDFFFADTSPSGGSTTRTALRSATGCRPRMWTSASPCSAACIPAPMAPAGSRYAARPANISFTVSWPAISSVFSIPQICWL